MKLSRLVHLLALMLVSTGLQFSYFAYSFLFTRVMPLNDVLLYGYWLQQMQTGQPIFGVSQPGVYPFPALIPMLAAQFLGASAGIVWGWVILTAILSAVVIGLLTDWGRAESLGFKAAWFWVAAMAALGPVAIGRIDAIAALVSIAGIVALRQGRTSIAAALFTFGAWVKIWPAALAIAAFISEKRKSAVAISVTSVTAAVFMAAILLGGNSNVLSFVFQQNSRGIQIESPVATLWLWLAKARVPNTGIYFDQQMITNQVYGGPIELIAAFLGLAMLAAVGLTAWLGWRGQQAGIDRNKLFAATGLAIVLDLIALNKVGSPQFMIWLAAPVIAGVIFQVSGWRFAIASTLALGLLTHLVYPIFYIDLMGLGDTSVLLLTARNILLITFAVWANIKLAKLRV